MADSTKDAPAQAPAENVPPVASAPPIPVVVAENRREELIKLNQTTIDNAKTSGRKDGLGEGVKLERERATAISAVCPNKPEMALAAILSGQTPDATKLAYDATCAAEAKAKDESDQKDLIIARWRSLAENGGFPNGVNMGIANDSNDEPREMTKEDAEAQAKNEWDTKPAVRKGFSKKERYVNYRSNELMGNVTRQVAGATA